MFPRVDLYHFVYLGYAVVSLCDTISEINLFMKDGSLSKILTFKIEICFVIVIWCVIIIQCTNIIKEKSLFC